MHRISHVVVSNFRSCRNVSLPLEAYTPLVGANNVGKTTILEAIRWALKPTPLTAKDFFVPEEPVAVALCIEGITPELLGMVPEAKHRSAIEPYCKNGKLWIRAIAAKPGANGVAKEVWEVERHDDAVIPASWRSYPTGLPQAVSVLLPEPMFIEAMDDIGEDLGKAKSGSTIKQLLDEIMVPILKAHADLNTALGTIRSILAVDGNSRSKHLSDFDQQATKALADFFPGLAIDLDLQVIDVKEFFKAGDLYVTDRATGDRRRFDQMGTGAQRSIQMALVRYLAESPTEDEKRASRRLLLIDEPELYLHPQGVRRLRQALGKLASGGFQVVFSTHSPLMLSRENAADTVIVSKSATDGVTTNKPLRHAVQEALAEAESQSRTLFELGNVAEIYFAKRVVLCEGKTDLRLLPLAYERVYGHPPEIDHLAFVSLGSCSNIRKALPVLTAMGVDTRVVADLDFAFTHARAGAQPLLDKEGTDLQQAKKVLLRLRPEHGFSLGGNGLPINDKKTGWAAADVWAIVAHDSDGAGAVQTAHESLLDVGVFVWPVGCIEHVTGHTDKGEDAIAEQEEMLRQMTGADVEARMPILKACFVWLRGLPDHVLAVGRELASAE
jgi:putative ATP-dependent endonuclease of OLD family